MTNGTSELGAKHVKFVDRPQFGLMLAQLDIEATNTSENDKTNKMNCAPSEDSVQPRNLIRVFVRRKFVDRPQFGLMLAQLDIEASLIGKFHSNPPSSF